MAADITIVGQGICGSLLSWSLLQKGISVKVYDVGAASSSTAAASGIINPITGKRFVKSWMVDQLFPVAEKTYHDIGQTLGVDFYKKIPIYKLLESVKEQNDLSARATEPGYEKYFPDTEIHYLDKEKVKNEFGSFMINGSGKLDTKLFISSYRNYLKEKDLLLEESFTYEQALAHKSKVIFCTGFKAAQSGLFKDLPWQIVKGEHLLVKIKDFYTDRIISGDKGIMPTSIPGVYYIGATYQWYYETEAPTESYRNELIEGLHKVLNVPFEVIGQGAGIRPSAKYRRPFIGFHPVHNHIGIFNGMGTKGISLSPYFAEHFAEHIVDGKELMAVVDVRQWVKPERLK
jgi:glycine/D-amino acid oxidase-like deaminating enzyme